ncbi:MAG TPA: GNAT family N-acetyltransferase [Rhodothermales bacterium]|nr:GNAT family N-acetyltransferase [Rhodothermales bacterium]
MISIKRVVKEDDFAKIIQDIKNATWVEASEIDFDNYTVAELFDFVSKETNILCVAYYDGSFAGMAFGYLLKKVYGDKWIYLDEIDVCKNHQRKGVASELMKYFFIFGKEEECSELWLGTERNNIPAQRLYLSLKPTEIEDVIGYYFNLENEN